MSSTSLRTSNVLPFVALATAYAATGWLGLNAAMEPGHASPVWPPSGIALAALLLGGVRLWPAVAAAAVAITWLAGPPLLPVLLAIPVGNTAEALLAYYCLQRAGFSTKMESVRDVRLLILWAAALPTMVAATIGSTALLATRTISPDLYRETWWTWWSGDFLGILIVTPLILLWARTDASERRYRRGELCLALFTGAVTSVLVALAFPTTLYLTVIPLLWAAGRLGIRGAVSVSAIVWLTFMILDFALHTWSSDAAQSAVFRQLYFAVFAIIGLTLGGALVERDSARAAVKDRDEWSRTVLELGSDLVAVIDSQARIKFITASSERTLGYPPEEMMGSPVLDFIHPDDLERVASVLEKMQGSSRGVTIRARARHKSGGWRTLEAISKNALENPSVRGIVVCSRDVTDQAVAERTLNEARDSAIESARLRSEFLANVSHELRTPLNVVFGMTDMLLDTELSSRQREHAGAVRGSAAGLLRLIDDILDLAKIDSGRLEIAPRKVDFDTVVREAAATLRPRAETKGLEFDVAVAEELRGVVWADPERLRQILLNYVSNAVKFTDRGRVSVRATLERETDDARYALVEVTDTGIGIPSHRMNRLFKPFSQVDGSMSRTYGGTGLGLAISKQLAEMMGGQVAVRSESGVGSTFSFTTRLARRAASEAAAAAGRS